MLKLHGIELRAAWRVGGEYFDALPCSSRPVFVRGDIGWGTERMMQEAEQRDQAYLFKIRQSLKIKEVLSFMVLMQIFWRHRSNSGADRSRLGQDPASM